MYKAKGNFTVLIDGQYKRFNKGDEVKGISQKEIQECLDKGLVENVPSLGTMNECNERIDVIFVENKNQDLNTENECDEQDEVKGVEEDKQEEAPTNFLTPQQVKDLKNKDEVVAYGQSLGLHELNDSFTRPKLDEMVIEYIETLKTGETDEEL